MSTEFILKSVPFEELKVGMSESYSKTITEEDVNTFAEISGDKNPIHLDEEYAKKTIYKKRIAHGLMTASYFAGLGGTKLPGEGCIYTSQSLKFKRPVFIGDTVLATIEIIKIDNTTRRVAFKTICRVDRKIVTIGEGEVIVP